MEPPVPLPEERRRFHRLLVTLPVEFSAFHPESGDRHEGQGVLKNFSLSGVFFHPLEPVPLQPGSLLNLVIATLLPPLNPHDATHIQARGEVVRLESPTPDNGHQGVAVTFLDFPSFVDQAPRVIVTG